jgi:hypothetical protein
MRLPKSVIKICLAWLKKCGKIRILLMKYVKIAQLGGCGWSLAGVAVA